MRSEEFISSISALAVEYEKLDRARKDIPLGVDSVGNITYARKREALSFTRHTCVTGGSRGNFIRRLLVTLSCLYDRSEICFFVLSPSTEYGELLRLKSMDLTLPYMRSKEDLSQATETLKHLLSTREYGKGYPRLVVVLDGLESLEDCNRNGDLEEYNKLLELLSRREDVDVVTGVELTKSIFSGYPGAFVGVGNCLIATRETGKADVTYVQEDTSLTMPLPLTYPDNPSLTETVLFFNSVSKEM